MNIDLAHVEAVHYPEGSIVQPKGSTRSIFKISDGTPCVDADTAERIVEGSAYGVAWKSLRDELDRRIENDKAMGFGSALDTPAQGIAMGVFECRRLMDEIESGEVELGT